MTRGNYMEAEQVEAMRATLTQAFGLEGTLSRAVFRLLPPHLSQRVTSVPRCRLFPTPVNQVIGRALPWTLGLAAKFYRHRLDSWAMPLACWPVSGAAGSLRAPWKSSPSSSTPFPYYITALILIILFIHINPIFPLFFSIRGDPPSLEFIASVVYNSVLPALSIVIVGFGWWVLSMKALSSSISEEDFVYFAKLKGAGEGRIMTAYVMRNAILPQVTVLALQIGAIFNGALITEILFSYPGLGTMTYNAVLQADYNLLMGTISISIIAVATSTLIIDLLYPFFDPRIRQR